jgi:glycosyltransferase involved in cell wall biosynthesis
VKGPETVAAGFAKLLDSAVAAHLEVHLVVVGGSSFCHIHNREMSSCMEAALPHGKRHLLHIHPAVPRGCIPAIVSKLQPGVSIFASEFETFNLAAHEIASMGIPLIVNDIATYAEFFSNDNAYVFRRGNATDLGARLIEVAKALTQGRPLLRTIGMAYADAIKPYEDIFMRPQIPRIPSSIMRHAVDLATLRVESHYQHC